MPTSPDSASCRRTSPGVSTGKEGPRAAPAHGQSPPIPAGLEPAQKQQGWKSGPGATRWEKLLIQGLGTAGCSGWAANPGRDPCCRVTVGHPGVLLSPRHAAGGAEPPSLPSPCLVVTVVHPHPSLPAAQTSTPDSPRTTRGSPSLTEPPLGFAHNAPRQPRAEGGGAAGAALPRDRRRARSPGSSAAPSPHRPGPALTEKPAHDGQERRILVEGVMVAATRLKVTMRTPRMAWTRPSTSRTCSQVRRRRRWVRLRELRAVSERLESVGEGMAAAGGGSGPAPEPRGERRHRARTAGSGSSRSAGTGRAPPFASRRMLTAALHCPGRGGSGSAHGHEEPGPPEEKNRTGAARPCAPWSRRPDTERGPGTATSSLTVGGAPGPRRGIIPPRGVREPAAGGSRAPEPSILRGRSQQGRLPLPGRYRQGGREGRAATGALSAPCPAAPGPLGAAGGHAGPGGGCDRASPPPPPPPRPPGCPGPQLEEPPELRGRSPKAAWPRPPRGRPCAAPREL